MPLPLKVKTRPWSFRISRRSAPRRVVKTISRPSPPAVFERVPARRFLPPAMAAHAPPRELIGQQNPFIHRPEEQVAKALGVAVYGCFRERRLLCPSIFPILRGDGFVDPADRQVREIRKEYLQPIYVPSLHG